MVYPEGYQPVTTGYYATINTRVGVGFPKWGFVIYRGTYGNDEVWEKFVLLLKINALYWLRDKHQEDELWPDLEWTIIEDRDTLDGAPKDAVRARFREWVAGRSVERDGPGVDGPAVVKRCPRFRFCVYVDQASLDSTRTIWTIRPGFWHLEGQLALIDGTYGHHDEEARQRHPLPPDSDSESEEEDEYPPIEGNTALDVGWRYIDSTLLVSAYEQLHNQGRMDWETWWQFYEDKRPYAPEVRGAGEPLATVDLSRQHLNSTPSSGG